MSVIVEPKPSTLRPPLPMKRPSALVRVQKLVRADDGEIRLSLFPADDDER